MKNRNRLIMGSALGLAAIAVAIDHTRHPLPEPVRAEQGMDLYQIEGDAPASQTASPCGLGAPCSLDGN